MQQLNLNKSRVVFDREHHTYHIGEKVLGGVTSIVKWVYPETYKDIPFYVLQRAAEYGTRVHALCELADRLGIVDDDTVRRYMEIKKDAGLRTVANEYLVSDNEDIASSIDLVLQDIEPKDERCFSLADIKTTSKVHEDNVRLQLSIYAYLFELNNPDCYVDRLFCLWLPKPQYGEGEIYEVKRVSTELCKAIIEAYVKGLEGLDFAEMIRNELKKN